MSDNMSALPGDTPTFRPRDRVVRYVPRIMEPRAGEVAVDLIPRYARVICVFDEMASLSVRWEDTGEHEILKRREVKIASEQGKS